MEVPERNLALDLVRITEAAALASARWLGKGEKKKGDQAAVDAMRLSFNAVNIQGRIVIGEGEKDQAPMLFNGEEVGTMQGPKVDVAVDPVEGTKLLAFGRPNAISVVGLAPAGSMYDPGPSYYMQKLVVPASAAQVVDLDAPVKDNLQQVARALDKDVDDLMVFVLDKPRHQDLIQKIREAGARIQLHTDGDVAGALMAVDPESEVDLLMGTGGTPEGVLSACAIKGLDGEMLCRLDPQKDEEKQGLQDLGVDMKQILSVDDLVDGEDVFFSATGISGGTFLPGVKYTGSGAQTYSLVLRGKTGTVRRIQSTHSWDKLMRFSAVDYD
ncbi:MAG: class II fructose-bisphosphatase [Desulfohalobiaceae bacterium]